MFQVNEGRAEPKRAVVIRRGVVVNRIVVHPDSKIPTPEGDTIKLLKEGERVGIGWVYDGEKFISGESPD